MDGLSKSENKQSALDTCNIFTFVVSHLAEDNRHLQYFIQRDFSAGASFCGSTSILKIKLGIPFLANSYFLIDKEVYQKITN